MKFERYNSHTAIMKLSLTLLSKLRVTRAQIPAHQLLPNCSIQQRPLLIYHAALPSDASASAVEDHFTTVGVARPGWRGTMFPISHFHSTTHEILAVYRGRARLCFGGEANPGRLEPEVEAGDVVVMPAGVAHRLLVDHDGDFEMVGSYPPGELWDMCYGREGEEAKVAHIAKLPWFERDPVYGDEGPALEAGDGGLEGPEGR